MPIFEREGDSINLRYLHVDSDGAPMDTPQSGKKKDQRSKILTKSTELVVHSVLNDTELVVYLKKDWKQTLYRMYKSQALLVRVPATSHIFTLNEYINCSHCFLQIPNENDQTPRVDVSENTARVGSSRLQKRREVSPSKIDRGDIVIGSAVRDAQGRNYEVVDFNGDNIAVCQGVDSKKTHNYDVQELIHVQFPFNILI